MSDILEIRIDRPQTDCIICGDRIFIDQGIPMYEGDVLPNDWAGPWAGFPTCRPCFDAQATLTEPMHCEEFAGYAALWRQ